MENTTNNQTWKPRRSETISRIVLELQLIQREFSEEFINRAYSHFNGFLAGLHFMHLLSDNQVKELNLLGQRATGFCEREPLPEGNELRDVIAEILFHMK